MPPRIRVQRRRLLQPGPVNRTDVGADPVDQPGALRRGGAARRRVQVAQMRRVPGRLGHFRTRRDRKRAGDIDRLARHPEGQQAIGSVEPLLVVVDQATRGIRHQQPVDRHAVLANHRHAGQLRTRYRIAAIAGNQQVDIVDPLRDALFGILHEQAIRAAVHVAQSRNLGAVADQSGSLAAQGGVQLGPADADAVVIGDPGQGQVEQHGAVGERDAPGLPGQAACHHGVMQRRVVPQQCLDGVRPDVEAGAGLRMVAGLDLFQAADVQARPAGEGACDDAAGDTGADDDDFHP